MEFYQYRPVFNRESIKQLDEAKRQGTLSHDFARQHWMHYQTDIQFADARRPFYRVYPNFLEAVLHLGIEKVHTQHISPPIPCVSIELPQKSPLKITFFGEQRVLQAVLVCETIGNALIVAAHTDVERISFLFPRETDTINDFLEAQKKEIRLAARTIFQLIFGVFMIPKDDSFLCESAVLSKDAAAYDASHDPKYIDKARRRGVFGWYIGRQSEEEDKADEEMEFNTESGRIKPHKRKGTFALRHTGPGRCIPIITWVRECHVNKDLLRTVPHGYYDDIDTEKKNE